MFERQIGYDGHGNKLGGRSKYFGVSTFFVSSLLATFLVASILAGDYSLPSENFELTSLLSPITAEQPPVETSQPAIKTASSASASATLPTRTADIARVDESQFVPDKIGVEPASVPSRPPEPFRFAKFNSDSIPSGEVRRNPGNSGPERVESFSSKQKPAERISDKDLDIPPPLADKSPRHIGILNGKAVYLPTPPYPAIGEKMGLTGSVTVQVLIDESGKVISADASSGPVLFRSAAVAAAKRARFTPTLLSKVPVKVTGVIIYHFTR